jgi:hypothetical protein
MMDVRGVGGGGILPFSDDFDRADGTLGSPWVGATWTISGNKAINAPTESDGGLIDGDMELAGDVTHWLDYNTPITKEKSSAQAHGGILSIHIVTDVPNEGASQTVTVPMEMWCALRGWLYALAGKQAKIFTTIPAVVTLLRSSVASWVDGLATYRMNGTRGIYLASNVAGGGEFYVDDVMFNVLTLSTLFSSVPVGVADVVAAVEIDTLVAGTGGTQAGLVLNLDSAAAPANFVIAYHDGTNAKLEKCVAGIYTSVISAAAAYVAGATIQVTKSDISYSLYYNGTQVGTTQTIADAGIINNTLHGLFSTYNGNQLDNFSLVAS